MVASTIVVNSVRMSSNVTKRPDNVTGDVNQGIQMHFATQVRCFYVFLLFFLYFSWTMMNRCFQILLFVVLLFIKVSLNIIIVGCVGSYGENCSHPCSVHCINGACDRFNGSCVSGCVDGFIGDKCKEGIYFWDEFILYVWIVQILRSI